MFISYQGVFMKKFIPLFLCSFFSLHSLPAIEWSHNPTEFSQENKETLLLTSAKRFNNAYLEKGEESEEYQQLKNIIFSRFDASYERCLTSPETHHLFVALEESSPIGYMCFEMLDSEHEAVMTACSIPFRSLSIGSGIALYRDILAAFPESAKVDTIYVFKRKDAPAIDFLKRIGFVACNYDGIDAETKIALKLSFSFDDYVDRS